MGGRGQWAMRRRQFAEDRRDVIGIRERRATMAGGGATDQSDAASNTTVTLSNGARVSGATDADIKRALGNNWTLEQAALTFGASKGSEMTLRVSGNTVQSSNVNREANISSRFRLVRGSDGVTFEGDSLFTATMSGNNVGGRAILPIVRGLRDSVNSGRVQKFHVGTAAGSARSTTTGSLFWAQMGASAPLSQVAGLPARPPALQSARSIAELLQMPGGKAWWTDNRRPFEGRIDFRQKNTAEYKLASKFLGLGRASRRNRS